MKVILWEYKTVDLPIGASQKETISVLNKEGAEGWEVVLVRDRKITSVGSTNVRLVFLLKRPCGERDYRLL